MNESPMSHAKVIDPTKQEYKSWRELQVNIYEKDEKPKHHFLPAAGPTLTYDNS